jgi:hypothetical protein
MARCYAMWGEAGVPAAHRHLRTSAAAGRPAPVRATLTPSDQSRVRRPLDDEDRSAQEAASEVGRP